MIIATGTATKAQFTRFIVNSFLPPESCKSWIRSYFIQNSGHTSDIQFPNPVTEKPPGCESFAAIQEKMFRFARLSSAGTAAMKSSAK
jgi:hypothetical protein